MNKITNVGKDTTLQLIQVAYEDIHEQRMPYQTFKRFEAMEALQLLEVYKFVINTRLKTNKSCIEKLERIQKAL